MGNIEYLEEYRFSKELKRMTEKGISGLNCITGEFNTEARMMLNPIFFINQLNEISKIKYPNSLLDTTNSTEEWLEYAWHTVAIRDLIKRELLDKAKKVKVISVDARIEDVRTISYKIKINGKFVHLEAHTQLKEIILICELLEHNIDLSKRTLTKHNHYICISETAKEFIIQSAKEFGLTVEYKDRQFIKA